MRSSGTTTSVAMMSRLPVAAMPSTCQVSLTSTSSTGSRKFRGAGRGASGVTAGPASSSTMRPLSSTQSAWQMPVPNCQCPDSTQLPSAWRVARPVGLTLPGARTKGCEPKTSSWSSSENMVRSQLCSM
jgi:hypothetical protein